MSKSISEASPSLGVGAYTASEMMSLRCLESILRYTGQTKLGKLNIRNYLTSKISYFKDVKNRAAHLEKIFSEFFFI